MKINLIKQLMFSLAVLTMQLSGHSQEKTLRNDEMIELHCFNLADTIANHHEWVSFKVKTSHYQGKSLLRAENKTCSIHYGEEFIVYFHDQDKDTYSCLTATDYKEIDNKNKTITIYSLSRKDAALAYIKYGLGGILNSFYDYLYYLYPTSIGELQIVDEIFYSEDEIMTGRGRRIRFSLEKGAVGKSIEEDTNIINSQYFIDPVGCLLDSVFVSTQADDKIFEKFVSLHDFDFSDKQNLINSCFDFEKPMYEGYSYKKQCE